MTERAEPPASADGQAPSTPEGAEPRDEQAGSGAPAALEASGSGDSAKVAAAPPAAPAWRPSYPFLVIVSVVTLAADLGSKWWAKSRLEDAMFSERHIDVIKGHLAFTFARNKGGAWGLLQGEPESIRRPFFLGISVLAIAFIVSLYRKLTPQQWALKWGLPLVLGGAIGNLVNRIQYNYVVDFIDYQGKWVKLFSASSHWPTFNVADIAIVVGVGLMAIDMFTPRRESKVETAPVATDEIAREPAAPPAGEAAPKET
ncbi:Lipoprotein signal peptidase [Minicystis rosea]|nr:Lipoprotein signal peptidase [Minicystis rosea]